MLKIVKFLLCDKINNRTIDINLYKKEKINNMLKSTLCCVNTKWREAYDTVVIDKVNE